MAASPDRRYHPRAPLDATVSVEVEGEPSLEILAHDVSDESLRGTASRPLPLGSKVGLQLELPAGFVPTGQSRLRILAEVVRSTPSGDSPGAHDLVLRFKDLAVPDEETLGRYIRRRNLLDAR